MAVRRGREYFRPSQGSREERRLVRKLDFFILSFCCLMYFMNYLDRSNLANAYVSGMKEDLGFKGDQLNQINTVFTVGYVIGQVPSNMALYYIKPRLFFPAMMLVWGGLTMLTATVRSPQAIMAIRFFQAVAESSTFVGTHYVLGSWYTTGELGKRSGIFTSAGLAGTMIGGFIQTGIHESLNGARGLAGWRWLFIIDGLVTLPIALYGFLLFPDTPQTTRAPYLAPAERQLAIKRLPLPSSASAPLTWRFARRALRSPPLYLFTGLWILAGEAESFSSNSLLALYLKAHPSHAYTVAQLNDYPTGVPAVGILATLLLAALTDARPRARPAVAYGLALVGIVTSALLLGPTRHRTAVVMAAYYCAGIVYAGQAVFFAWANDVCRRGGGDGDDGGDDDDSLRALVLACMNMASGAVNAWWSILFYPADDAPWFTRGMWAMIAVCLTLAVWTAGLDAWVRRRERRVRRAVEGEAEVEQVEVEVEQVRERVEGGKAGGGGGGRGGGEVVA